MEPSEESYRLLACRYLRKQLDVLTKELEGVQRANGIECVHKARVASRRMRTGLAMFSDCFSARITKKWGKRIKKLTRGLGVARDTDVQIEYVEKTMAGLGKHNRKHEPGLKRLTLRLRQRREALQPKVVKAVRQLESGQMLSEMHGELAKTLFELKRRKVPARSPYLFERTRRHIADRIQDMFFYKKSLEDPQDVSGHHLLRIAAKKLRYTMEICNGLYSKKLSQGVNAIRKVQSSLGEIHDCDVWEQLLDRFLVEERQRMLDYYGHDRPLSFLKPGLEFLREQRKASRDRIFVELVERWTEMETSGFWDEIAAILESSIERPRQAESRSKDEQVRSEDKRKTKEYSPDQRRTRQSARP